MKHIRSPELPWLGLHFQCTTPECGGVVELEESDLTGIAKIKPRQRGNGRWEAQMKCPWCHQVVEFREVAVRADGPATEPVGASGAATADPLTGSSALTGAVELPA